MSATLNPAADPLRKESSERQAEIKSEAKKSGQTAARAMDRFIPLRDWIRNLSRTRYGLVFTI
jgi:hypothetical protein